MNYTNGSYYHIFNRGVDKRVIFSDPHDYVRFLESLRLFNQVKPIGSIYRLRAKKDIECPIGHSMSEPGHSMFETSLVTIICYCLNPNHFHLLLRQENDNGIPEFMRRISDGYTKYFNYRNKRKGVLFEGRYHAVVVSADPQLLYTAVYINTNSEIHGVARADEWIWSSQLDYLDKRNGTLTDKSIVLNEFRNIVEYQDYCKEVINNSRQIKAELKEAVIE